KRGTTIHCSWVPNHNNAIPPESRSTTGKVFDVRGVRYRVLDHLSKFGPGSYPRKFAAFDNMLQERMSSRDLFSSKFLAELRTLCSTSRSSPRELRPSTIPTPWWPGRHSTTSSCGYTCRPRSKDIPDLLNLTPELLRPTPQAS